MEATHRKDRFMPLSTSAVSRQQRMSANSKGGASLVRRRSRVPSVCPESAMRAFAGITLAGLAVLSLGCAVGAQEGVGVAAEDVVYVNGLDPNALHASTLYANALTPAALSPTALDPAALSPSASSAIQDPGSAGALSRALLQETVSCAFTPSQSFSFSWTDSQGVGHDEAYPGLVSLAPSWASQPLGLTGQQWVSACLASRINGEGATVSLSARGQNEALACSRSELSDYPTREAAFFGNLFTTTPTVYACYDAVSTVLSDLAKRVCSQTDLLTLDLNDLPASFSCGAIDVLGPCLELELLGLIQVQVGPCARQHPVQRYYDDCAVGGSTIPSITTFFQPTL
jgi:hypothetical protein